MGPYISKMLVLDIPYSQRTSITLTRNEKFINHIVLICNGIKVKYEEIFYSLTIYSIIEDGTMLGDIFINRLQNTSQI